MNRAAASRVAVAVSFPEKRSRAERRGEAPVMRRGAQRPHVNVEFVSSALASSCHAFIFRRAVFDGNLFSF